VITSCHNKRVMAAARLKKRALRQKDRRFLVEGFQGVIEALRAGVVKEVFLGPEPRDRLERVREAADTSGVRVDIVSQEVMAHLTSTVTPQGVVAVARFVDADLATLAEPAAQDPFVSVLIHVRDPGNAGTILRSADASGASGVVFTESSVDVYNPKTVRASSGSLFHVPVVRQVDAADVVSVLRRAGFRILAADADGTQSIYDADIMGPVAILFGNEARGLQQGDLVLADTTVRVPLAGRAESLNLAAAAALVLFECARRRTHG
jgi:RNA methyltransferase, TrmH family